LGNTPPAISIEKDAHIAVQFTQLLLLPFLFDVDEKQRGKGKKSIARANDMLLILDTLEQEL
jgi:hypothetical protein